MKRMLLVMANLVTLLALTGCPREAKPDFDAVRDRADKQDREIDRSK